MKYVTDPELFIKYCEPVSNADVELQNCPFEYEYDNSPISSPSQPTGILMLSLTSNDSDDQSSSGHENEEFETPPEQNNSSQPYFSGSDDLKPSTSANGDTASDAVNHDNNTEAVDLGNDSDDPGFSNRLGIEEQVRKRYRVSKEDLDVKKEPIVIEIDQTQTQEVDTEVIECEESIKVYERRNGRNADKSTVKMSERSDEEGGENGERGVDDYGMRENGEKGVDNNEMRENGEKGVDDNEKLNGVGTGEGNGRKDGVGDGGRGVVSMNLDEKEKLNGVCAKEMHSNGITRSVGVGGDGEKGVVSMNEKEKLSGVCAKEMNMNGITRSVDVGVNGVGGGGEKRREFPLSMREGDKNVGLVEEVDGGGGAGNVEGRRELPFSMRGGDKNVGLVEEVGRRETKNGGRFKDLMEAFSVVVGDVSSDDKNDADFFETAKRRGWTFPRPRWWPPEGFSD